MGVSPKTVETYRAVKSGGEAEAPAIIVQRLIAARVSGVAFSHTSDGDSDG